MAVESCLENCQLMPPSHRKFGDLLQEGIKRVHITRKKPIGYILDEFGYALRPDDSSKGRHSLGHWYYKKRIPADSADVAILAELIVTNSDVDRVWLKAFLESANFPTVNELCERFFASEQKSSPVIKEVQANDKRPENSEQKKEFGRHAWALYILGVLVVLSIALLLFIQKSRFVPSSQVSPTTNLAMEEVITPTVIVPTIQVTEIPTSFVPTMMPVVFDGQCPTLVSSSGLDFEYISSQSFVDFLNQGGSFEALQSKFKALVQDKTLIRDGRVMSVELTGDDVPEVVISAIFSKGSVWQILGCSSGQFQPLIGIEDSGFRYLRFAVDLNGNQLPEILSYRQTENESVSRFEFFVQAWNGEQIVDLVDNTRFDQIDRRLPADIFDWQRSVANATVTTRDTNGDGLYEVIVMGGLITPVPTCETRFERQFTETWAWNGSAFHLIDRVYIPPIYRFQRSADGDLAFALGHFEQALKAYQDVIADEDLFRRDQYLSHLEFCKGIDSAPSDSTLNEQDQLEAYAHWRIMLITALTSSQSAVEAVYQTLQNEFPKDTPGEAYTEIASAFWDVYQTTQNIASACEAANIIAENRVLYPAHSADDMCFIP